MTISYIQIYISFIYIIVVKITYQYIKNIYILGFPVSSAGKESSCNTRDPSLFPGSGRSPGEGIGYPLQYSWASLAWSAGKESACNVGDLGWEDPLEKGRATHSNILAWRNSWTEEPMG